MKNQKTYDFIEGHQATDNFQRAMKTAFRVSKVEIKVAEKRDKEQRKRKKS
jgi:hypothetical protein